MPSFKPFLKKSQAAMNEQPGLRLTMSSKLNFTVWNLRAFWFFSLFEFYKLNSLENFAMLEAWDL